MGLVSGYLSKTLKLRLLEQDIKVRLLEQDTKVRLLELWSAEVRPIRFCMVPQCDRWTRGWNQTMDATNCSLSNSCFDRSRRLQEAIHLQGARHGDLGINGGSFDASLHLRSHFISDVTKTGTNATNFGRTFQKTGSEVELG